MLEIIKHLSELPKTLFSPFKLFFIGYIILISLDKIKLENFWEFFGIAVIIMFLEIAHNDFLRIILNDKAKEKTNPSTILRINTQKLIKRINKNTENNSLKK